MSYIKFSEQLFFVTSDAVFFPFRLEGRSWYTAHRGRLWIASTAKNSDKETIQHVENNYRSFYPGKENTLRYFTLTKFKENQKKLNVQAVKRAWQLKELYMKGVMSGFYFKRFYPITVFVFMRVCLLRFQLFSKFLFR